MNNNPYIVRRLEARYKAICEDSDHNTHEAINAFHEWYKALLLLLKCYYTSDNEDFRYVKNVHVSGNGYSLHHVYNEISPRCEMMLDDIEKGIVQENRKEVQIKIEAEMKQLVFISHASTDEVLIREFIDNILKNGLGLEDKDIVCTTFEWTTVEAGNNISEYIKNNIASASVVLAMVSKAYQKSAVCQNEVGAAWALGNKPISIVLPDADFNELGWLFKLDKAIKINHQDSLNLLQETLCKRLGLKIATSLHWTPCVTKFLEAIGNMESKEATEDEAKESQDVGTITLNEESLKHDRTLFDSFNSEFGEEKIKYSLYSIQTSSHYSDYDLTIWYRIKAWLEKTSNSFIDPQLQEAASRLLNAFNDLTEFTAVNYSPDRNSWNYENDHDVTKEKWREIHESRIYSWEPYDYDSERYNKKESIVVPGIMEHVPKVEDAYKSFRLKVKNRLFV